MSLIPGGQQEHQHRIAPLSVLLQPLRASAVLEGLKTYRTTRAFAFLLLSSMNSGNIAWGETRIELQKAFGEEPKSINKDCIKCGEYGLELVVKVLSNVRLESQRDEREFLDWTTGLAHAAIEAIASRSFRQRLPQPQPQLQHPPPPKYHQEKQPKKKLQHQPHRPTGPHSTSHIGSPTTKSPEVSTTETLPMQGPLQGETKQRKRQELKHQIEAIRMQLEAMQTPEPAAPVAGPSGWKRGRQDNDGQEKKGKKIKQESSE